LEAGELARAAAATEGHDVPALEDDRPRRRTDEADGRASERRLAAPRLADEPHDLSAVDADARPRDRADAAVAAALVVDDDVGELERGHLNGSTGQASARPFEAASSGTFTRQSSCAYEQRGLNAQPAGMRPGLGGEPGIATRGWSRRS